MMTAEQLKGSILQLAMQGKLVDQRSEEGTGEDLYKTLLAEKKKLIKEDVLNQYNEHTRYLKPSAKKHQKKVKADHIRKKILEAETIENAKMSKKKNETSVEER